MNRNKYKNFVLQNLSSEHVILNFVIKLSDAAIELKIQFFYEIIFSVFQFTQHAIENRLMCHRLPTPSLKDSLVYNLDPQIHHLIWL
jgi:hypothetical protein